MPAKDLYKLILQNIRTLDPGDAIFELNQLKRMIDVNFSKAIDLLSDPDVTGKPKVLNKIQQMVKHQFQEWQSNQQSVQN